MHESDSNCLALRQAARRVTAVYGAALSEAGLRSTRFSILAKISAHGALTFNESSAAMVMDRTTLARNLKPLERDQLVQVMLGQDRGECVVTLTADGKAKIKAAVPLWHKAQRQFDSGFGSNRAQNLRRLLGALVQTDGLATLG
jgi:DNA-binding MarR family transcriptional regulator